MEAKQKRAPSTRNRKPLSDCTNSHAPTSFQSSSSAPSVPLNPSKPNPSTSSSAFNKITKSKSATTTNASNSNRTSLPPPPSRPVVCRRRHTSDARNRNNLSNANVSTPSRTPKTFSVAGTSDCDVSGPISIFYSHRQASDKRNNKEKAVINPVGTPNPMISDNWEKSDRAEGLDLPKAKTLTVPCRKKKCSVEKSNEALLRDFIEKQKAYFKEIDEFPLSEEEVESIDELD